MLPKGALTLINGLICRNIWKPGPERRGLNHQTPRLSASASPSFFNSATLCGTIFSLPDNASWQNHHHLAYATAPASSPYSVRNNHSWFVPSAAGGAEDSGWEAAVPHAVLGGGANLLSLKEPRL